MICLCVVYPGDAAEDGKETEKPAPFDVGKHLRL